MILIKGGRVVDPKTKTDRLLNVVISEDKIIFIGKHPVEREYERVIEADGMIVAPGLVDVHVHFRDPGLTYKEDIQTGSNAAARGGFTTVVCMANTKPVADNPDTLREILDSARKSKINVYTVAAVSKGFKGRELTDMARLKEMGAVGFSDDGVPLCDSAFVRKAMLAAKEQNVPISLHEEDPALIGTPGVNDGEVSAALGFTGAPSVSESSMVARDCMLALDTGAKTHIQHVSCAGSVEVIRLAKTLGANVTAEVTPQHLFFTQDEFLAQGTLAKINPPFRTEHDRESLIQGLKDGVIDIIATDHAPHAADEKAQPLPQAPSGLIGLETALSVGITSLVREGKIDLMNLLEKMTCAPAELYSFDAGRISEGGKADIVIFDEREDWTVSDFLSKSSNSPFIGKKLYGKVKYTICGGEIVYEDNEK